MFAPGTELLDDPAADPALVRRSLGNIARANQAFGGTRAVIFGVERLLGSHDPRRSTLDLLDLGTGAGDIPAALRAWGRTRALSVRTIGLERLRAAATLARTPELPVTLGCVSTLPFRSRSVDIVTLSQVLHHFDHAAAVTILREAARVSRLGVVVADLLRSRTAALLFDVGARLLRFDHHTRVDGVTSVGRGYRPDELLALTREAGLASHVTSRPGWRVVAWGAAA